MMHPRILVLSTLLSLVACDLNAQTMTMSAVNQESLKPLKADEREDLFTHYTWMKDVDIPAKITTLEKRFPVPSGYQRVATKKRSHAEFLRGLPIRLDRTNVLSHAGKRLASPSAAIVLLDVGEKNLQQCADSAIRLHAEWLWAVGRAEEVSYHFTSGDLSTWRKWQRGERFKIEGSDVESRMGAKRPNTHAAFRSYLDHTFRYAGTRSLRRDSRPVKLKDIQAGDFFVAPGSPGHAVVILDVARDGTGGLIALIGQGYMPAQEFHVLESRSGTIDDVWFKIPTEGEGVKTPSWAEFSADQLRRFR